MSIIANQIVYNSQLAVHRDPDHKKKNKSNVLPVLQYNVKNSPLNRQTKMLFTQRLNSKRDISIFPHCS